MMHIREYPEAESLRNWLVNLWELGLEDYMESAGLDESPFDVELEEIIIKGSWGRGDASLGDELEIHYVFPEMEDVDDEPDFEFPGDITPTEEDEPDPEDELAVIFNAINNHVRADMPLIMDAPTIPIGPQEEYFGEISIEQPIIGEDNLRDFLVIHFQATPGEDRAYSITEEESLTVRQPGDDVVDDTITPEDVIIIRDIGKEMSYADLLGYAQAKVDEGIVDEIDVPSPEELTPSDVAEIMTGPHPDEYPTPADNFLDLPGGSINIFIEDEDEEEEEDIEAEFIIVREELPLEPEPEPEPEPDPEEVIEEEPEDEEIEIDAIDISEQVDEQEGVVEVPTGKKQSTLTEYRELYDFERELLAIGDGPTELEPIREGIGEHMGRGTFGSSAPALTFPRTGVYLKHRLQHEGPAYVREMHKDLCRYSWAIIEEYQVYVRPGLYENFRSMVNKYKQAGLIRPLSTTEAQDLGLSVFPETPDGRTAYFLEQRQYYDIVEDQIENNAWYDVNKYLYSDD